jgi:hypothetical protein
MAHQDEMANDWGVDYVRITDKLPRKTFDDFDVLIRQSVPGFKLDKILAAGTHVNMDALQQASDYNVSNCAFAYGAYVGGDEYLQEMSTSAYEASSSLSLPMSTDRATGRCMEQTVVLPYYVPGQHISQSTLDEYEDKCLRKFHKMLILRKWIGSPIRALLVELILGGNGAGLSNSFLDRLGGLCKQFDVVIVADEVLTAGRAGPGMTMTTSTPANFLERVEYITIGKFVKCALVLKKVPKKPTSHPMLLRGTSTHHDVGEAYAIWKKVSESIKKNMIPERREQVEKAMRSSSQRRVLMWGSGLLLFSELRRGSNLHSLKNRLLPMLDTTVKIRKLSCQKSEWTPAKLTASIMENGDHWFVAQAVSNSRDFQRAFISELIDFLFDQAQDRLEPADSKEVGYIRFRPEDVVSHMGEKKAKTLAYHLQRERAEIVGHSSNAAPLTFVKQAVLKSAISTYQERNFYKKKKTGNRTEFTFVKASLFGCTTNGSRLTFWS